MRRQRQARAFVRANELWFRDGRTAAALRSYDEASRADSDDPVIAFQYARALLATGRDQQAQELVPRIVRGRDRLTPLGRTLVDELLTLLHQGGFDPVVGVDLEDLDVDRLAQRSLPLEGWIAAHVAAERRNMTGVAAYTARRLSGGTLESVRDLEEAQLRIDQQLHYLSAMSAGANGPADETPRPVGLTVHAWTETPYLNDDTQLHVKIRNVANRTQLVNTRLLVNTPDAPPEHGELALLVTGPRGYQNKQVVRIRAGRPPASAFERLHPDDERRTAIRLATFESLHVPGTYEIRVAYQNTTEFSAVGLTAVVGRVKSPVARLLRRA
jgi:hypothetical protein